MLRISGIGTGFHLFVPLQAATLQTKPLDATVGRLILHVCSQCHLGKAGELLARDSGTSHHRTGPGNAAEVGADAEKRLSYRSVFTYLTNGEVVPFRMLPVVDNNCETATALSSRGPAVVSVRWCETQRDRAHIP